MGNDVDALINLEARRIIDRRSVVNLRCLRLSSPFQTRKKQLGMRWVVFRNMMTSRETGLC